MKSIKKALTNLTLLLTAAGAATGCATVGNGASGCFTGMWDAAVNHTHISKGVKGAKGEGCKGGGRGCCPASR